MQPTAADGRSLVDRSSNLGGTSSLEVVIVGIEPDNQISQFASSQKIVFLQMSWQPEVTKELSNEEKKHFDPGGCWGEPPLQRAVVLVSLAGRTGFLDAWFVSFLFCFLLSAES